VLYFFDVTPPRANFPTAVMSHPQEEYENNPSREQKNAAVFAIVIRWRNITVTSFKAVTAVSTSILRHKRKISFLWWFILKKMHEWPKSARNILTNTGQNLTRNPARPEKPRPTYISDSD